MAGDVKRVLILASSAKNKNLCVAGLDLKEKKLIRLVSNDKDTDGAIPKTYMSGAHVGDVVDISVLHPYPTKCQPENYLVNPNKKIHIQERYNTAQIIEQMKDLEYHEQLLFGNVAVALDTDEMKINHVSLAWVHVFHMSVYLKDYNGKARTRADFSYQRRAYHKLRVTDPSYFDCDDTRKISEAYLLMSLPKTSFPPHDPDGLYYKFVASIFRVDEEADLDDLEDLLDPDFIF